MTVETFQGHKLYGIPLRVKEGEERTIEITYHVDNVLSGKSPLSTYTLEYFQQSGIVQIPYTLEVSFPTSLRPLSVPEYTQQKIGKLSVTKELREDTVFTYQFSTLK